MAIVVEEDVGFCVVGAVDFVDEVLFGDGGEIDSSEKDEDSDEDAMK
jgi:hypothetical protein